MAASSPQTVGSFFERITVQFQKCEQMFVEANCFVIVAVEQALPVQLSFIDQTRQMHVTAELRVRAARMQFLHQREAKLRARAAPQLPGCWIRPCARSPLFVPVTIRPG